ncbi:MAG: hypothetical protein P1P76_08615 [Anaerolineales bacterium]|nr:hypothetical protein [Anaerolineales bacterium]
MRELAENYPRIFIALVFSAVTDTAALAVAGFYILILRSDGLIAPGSGTPYDAYLFIYILILPGLLTFLVAAMLGRELLGDPTMSRLRAGSIGAGIAAVSFALWALAGELLWAWIDFPAPNPTGVDVIDFLAVLGYGLMGLVFVVVVMLGGMAGDGLSAWWRR